MRKLLPAVAAILLLPLPFAFGPVTARAHLNRAQEGEGPRVLTMPRNGRRRRVRGDRRRKGRHGIGRAFKRAGLSAGRGGKGFGRNVARGRVARGSKELGKGMGGFGKHTGRGVGRTMRRVFKP